VGLCRRLFRCWLDEFDSHRMDYCWRILSSGHDGEGVMVDNVRVVAMVRRDDRMTGLIDVAVTVDVQWAGELT